MKQVAKKLLSVVFALCLAVVGIVTTPTVEASAASESFVKVTSAPSDWSGTYLIVYEAENFAFNGSLTTLDASNNYVAVTVANDKIEATDDMKAYAFTVEKPDSNYTNYTIKSASGYYIGNTADSNKLYSSTSTKYTNTITLNSDGSVQVVGSGKSVLRYNAASGDERFRYYKSSTYTGQKAIALYKLTEEGAVAPERNAELQTAVNGIQSYMSLAYKYTATTVEKAVENKVVFELGENGSVGTHVDGNDATTYTETVGDYTLELTATDKMYTGAFAQGTGDSCIKLGPGSAVGGFTFTVPAEVLSVRIAVAGYKANLASVTVNGETTSVETTSNDGVFTDITVDTTSTKEVTLTTETKPDKRAMVNSITYVFAADANAGTVKETTLSGSEFRFRCGVDAGVSAIEGITAYGIQVSVAGKSPVQYTTSATSWDTEGAVSFVVVSLGDIINRADRLTTKFTVQAYVADANFVYVSESVKTYSVVDMVEEYKAIPEVAHLYNYLVEKGLIEEVA